MITTEVPTPISICVDCLFMLANGTVSDDQDKAADDAHAARIARRAAAACRPGVVIGTDACQMPYPSTQTVGLMSLMSSPPLWCLAATPTHRAWRWVRETARSGEPIRSRAAGTCPPRSRACPRGRVLTVSAERGAASVAPRPGEPRFAVTLARRAQ